MILHIDMDAFYASVEERDKPELRGKPVIVGGTPQGRGVVSAANYVAREFGVHSAMPAATAVRLCPEAAFIRPRMQHYANISQQIREIFFSFTPLVEPLSLDEAFLDVRGSVALFGTAAEIATQIKTKIREQLQLIASAGVAPNKFLAKIASDLKKPDGLVVVDPDDIQGFLDPLPISRIWGIGSKGNKRFQLLGVKTIEQLRQLPLDIMRDQFGTQGEHFWRLAHGIDDRNVVPDRTAKSISHETTFSSNISEIETLRAWLLELTEQVARRLRRHHLFGATVQIKVRFSDFRTLTRRRSISPSNSTEQLWRVASDLLTELRADSTADVRLLGMGVSGLKKDSSTQQTLFDAEVDEKSNRLDASLDEIRERYGSKSLKPGSSLRLGRGIAEDNERPKPKYE